jgi:hypothetical protein
MDPRRVLLGQIAKAYGKVRGSHGERVAYGMVLVALADFLTANGLNGPVPIWLMELGSALTDLDDGIVRPLLATEKRKSLPSNEWRRRAYVCLGMRALVHGMMQRKEAAQAARRASKTAARLSVNELVTLYDQFLYMQIATFSTLRMPTGMSRLRDFISGSLTSPTCGPDEESQFVLVAA